MKLLWSTHLSNLQNSVPSMGPDCLEINLNVSLGCVLSITLTILHHELSRCVCLITEQLFKFLSSRLPRSYQRRLMMHRLSSGGRGNPLNWRLDSSILYDNFYFSSSASWTFWYVVFIRSWRKLKHSGCMSVQLRQRETNETLITSTPFHCSPDGLKKTNNSYEID